VNVIWKSQIFKYARFKMLLSKKYLLTVAILVIIVGGFSSLIMREHFSYPRNQFGIDGSEDFQLTHLYNVNGSVGAEKTEFTATEKRKLMKFIGKLDYKEPLPSRTETIYGIPVQLKIIREDGSSIVFSLFSNVEEIEYDKDGNILNQNIYTTTEKQQNSIYEILGITKE